MKLARKIMMYTLLICIAFIVIYSVVDYLGKHQNIIKADMN